MRSLPWLWPAVALLLLPGEAAAELRVENTGQPALVSSVPQPPLVASARGSCADIYDAPEANGEGGTCGAGAWPGPGGDWGAALEVASGDRLLFHSRVALASVAVAATENFPLSLTTPDGQRVRNETVVGPLRAEPTDAAHTMHALTLPPLNPRARNGLAFAVVTTAGDGTQRHYGLSIRTPRRDRYGASCSVAWYAPDSWLDECQGQKRPPAPPQVVTPAPVAAPRAPRVAQGARRIGRRLLVRVRAGQDGWVRAALGRRRSAWTAVRAGRWRVVGVPLRAGRRLPRRVTVRVTLRTATGTVAVGRRLVVRAVR